MQNNSRERRKEIESDRESLTREFQLQVWLNRFPVFFGYSPSRNGPSSSSSHWSPVSTHWSKQIIQVSFAKCWTVDFHCALLHLMNANGLLLNSEAMWQRNILLHCCSRTIRIENQDFQSKSYCSPTAAVLSIRHSKIDRYNRIEATKESVVGIKNKTINRSTPLGLFNLISISEMAIINSPPINSVAPYNRH